MTTTETEQESGSGRSLARNFTLLLGSQASTFIMTLAGVVVIPRFLGAEVIGRLQLASAIWALGGGVIGFGMNLAITKAVARDNTAIKRLFATTVVARMLLAIPVTASLYIWSLLAGYDQQVLLLMLIVGISTIILAITESAVAALMGVERVEAISAGTILGRFVAVVGAIVLLLLGLNVYAVAIIAVAGTVVTTAIVLVALRRIWQEFDDVEPWSVDRTAVIQLLADSRPYFSIGFLMIAYRQIDLIVMSLVVEDDAVLGWYSVYERLVGTLMFPPLVFMSVVYPTLSRIYGDLDDATDRNVHNRLTERTFRIMMLVSVPAGFGLAVLSRPIIELLYGNDFSEAAPLVVIGGIVVSLTYLNTVFGIFLISMDLQKSLTFFLALSVVLTIPLDLYLVPLFQLHFENGAIGGAIAYAITESVMLAGAIYLLPRGALGTSAISYAARVIAGGCLMVAAVYPLREQFLLLPIAVGAVVFAAAALLFRLVNQEDRALFLSFLPDRFSVR